MEEKLFGIVYLSTNLCTGFVYVGQTITSLKERINGHYKKVRSSEKSTYFINTLRKYGKENFKWEIIDKAYSRDELNKLEMYWIKHYHSFIGDSLYIGGYNMTMGGSGNNGFKPSAESIAKKVKSSTGQKRSAEARKNISDSLKGIIFSEEHIKNLSKSSELRNAIPVICLETLEIFPSLFHACKKYGDGVNATIYNRSKSAHGFHFQKYFVTENYQKIPVKKIECVELCKYFFNAKEAEFETGVSAINIRNCLRGTNKTAGKLHWQYKDVYL